MPDPTPLEEALREARESAHVEEFKAGNKKAEREADAAFERLIAAAKAEAVEPFMRAYNLGSTILMMEAYRAAEARHALSTSTEGG